MALISIVAPIYKSRDILPVFIDRLTTSLDELTSDYEIILVDDGCPESSWDVITEIAKKNSLVKGVKLSRNFGQNNAINAGLKFITGDWIIVMDCDLQDRPSEITNFYYKALEGYEIVVGKVKQKRVGFYRRIESIIFYRIFNFFTGLKANSGVGNFGI